MDKCFGPAELNLAAVAGTSCGLGEVGESFTSLENMPRSFGTWGERTATAETSLALGLNMPW